MSRDQVSRGITNMLVERFGVPRDQITPNAHFFADLGLDSVDLLSAIAILEDHYGISIPDQDLAGMLVVDECVSRLVAYLKKT